jgi:hypothetical protein
MDDINIKILINLTKYLELKEILKLSLICKRWNTLILYNDKIFYFQFKNYLRRIGGEEYEITGGATFRQITPYDLIIDTLSEQDFNFHPFQKKNLIHILLLNYRLFTTTERLLSQLFKLYFNKKLNKKDTILKTILLLLQEYYSNTTRNIICERILLYFELYLRTKKEEEVDEIEKQIIKIRPKKKKKLLITNMKSKKNVFEFKPKDVSEQFCYHDLNLFFKIKVKIINNN